MKTSRLVSLFAFVGTTVLAQIEDPTNPCVLQFDSNIKCLLDVIGSEEAKVIENKTKTIFHTVCAPDYPLDCFSEFEAAKQCYVDTKLQLDTVGDTLKTEKDAAFAASEACLGKKPTRASFLDGLEDIFLPSPIKMISGRLGRNMWGERGKKEIGVPPIAAAILHGLNPTSTIPPPPALSTVAGGETVENGTSGPFGRPECAPKPKQFMCTFKELMKMNDTDPEFQSATATLKRGADLCKKVLEDRCNPKTPDENECVARAHMSLIMAFVDSILDCMKTKGYTVPPILPRGLPTFTPRPKS